jgi:hypothetical protein
MPIESGRTETRILKTAEAQLIEIGEPPFSESVITENVSSYGARVRSNNRWDVGLMVQFILQSFQSPALVVYCERTSFSHFAVGLQFTTRRGKYSPEGDFCIRF